MMVIIIIIIIIIINGKSNNCKKIRLISAVTMKLNSFEKRDIKLVKEAP